MKISLMIFLIGIIVIGFDYAMAEEIESEFGEYSSPGNVWVEITHSAQNPPIWSIWKGTVLKQNHPDQWKNQSTDFKIAQKFYDQFDISILNVISSNKNAEICEAVGCLFGTFHLLVSEKDSKKFQTVDFEYLLFSTIPPKKQQDIWFLNGEITCKQELDLIFKASDRSPACVKSDSVSKLIERGWAKSVAIPNEDTSIYEEKFLADDFSYQMIIEKLEKNERVSVIVILNTDNTPYDDAKGNLELKSKVVSELQNIVLSKLPDSPDSKVHKFKYVAGFGINLNKPLLDYLVNSSYVNSLEENKEYAPHLEIDSVNL